MKDNSTRPLEGKAETATTRSDEAARPGPILKLRRKGVMGPLVLVGLAIVLRLVLVDVPRALASWNPWTGSGGDPWDYPCDDCEQCPPPGGCSPFADNTGQASCSACGMAIWGVSEPRMTLWLRDEPLSYQPSHGRPIKFQLFYKSNPDDISSTELSTAPVFGIGGNWFTPWRSYLRSSGGSPNYNVSNGRGGLPSFDVHCDSTLCTYSNSLLRGPMGFATNGSPTVTYASGAQDVFGWQQVGADGYTRDFLSEKHDPNGNVTKLNWTLQSGVAVLSSITDVDGKSTTFTYTNITTFYNTFVMLYKVTDPCGHVATLDYNQDLAQPDVPALTNITDAVGLSSGIQYDDSGVVSALVNGYGTNTFTLFNNPPAVHVNALGQRDYLYVYVHTNTYCQMTNSYQAWCPSTVNGGVFSFGNTFDYSESDQRNSFFWGPRQYNLLSSDFLSALTNGTPSVEISYLYQTNYIQARQRHWLVDANSQPGQVLSLERAQSPDGVTQGQITWYDYAGKAGGTPSKQSSSAFPLFQAWTLPNGESRFIRYERNDWANPTQAVETYSDTAGSLKTRTNTLVYAANSIDLLSVTNTLGVQVVSNMFNSKHQVRTNYNALREKTIYTYDSTNRLVTVRTPAGLTSSNYYGADAYLAQTTDLEIGRSNSFTWSNGLIASQTDERGLTLNFIWDGLNRLLKTTHPDGKYVTNSYDKLDLVQVIDRMGFTNRYEYNGFHQVLRAVDALLRTNIYDYCDCGDLNSITDPLGHSTIFTHDLAYRRTRIAYADNFVVTNNYDLMGRLTNVQDSAGMSVTNWFNNQGLLIGSSNGVGRVQALVYDSLDRAITNIDVNAVAVSSSYDDLNRLTTQVYPDNGTNSFGYSANVSGATSYTNQLGTNVTYIYDQAGRETNEVYQGVTTNVFGYDTSGNLTGLTDGKLQTTAWGYDEYGRVTNKVDAASNVLFVYKYDLDNRLTNRNSAAKGTTVYKYDAVGNLTNITYPTSPAISFAYDPMNRVTNMVDSAGTTLYTYNEVGQILTEDGPWADDTVSFSYNNRLRSGLSVLAPNGSAWSQSYGYDSAERLTSLSSPAGSFSYGLGGASAASPLIKKLTLPSGAYITNTYDSVARLLSTVLKTSGGTITNSHSYAYNVANQRTGLTNTLGDYRSYTYDGMGQLKTARGVEPGGVTSRLLEQFGYAYDAAGNLNYRTNNGFLQTFNVNSLNELTTNTRSGSFTVAGSTTSPATNVTVNTSNAVLYVDYTFASTNQSLANGNNTFTAIAKDNYGRQDTSSITVSLPATNIYTYDLNGNLTSDGKRGFDYDDENQLIRVTVTNSWKTDFVYDGLMRRRERYESSWIGGKWVTNATVFYVYDGNLVIQERDQNNLPQVTYTRGTDLGGTLQGAGGIGGLLAWTDNGLLAVGNSGAHAYYHADGNGNITCLINSGQKVVAKYLYDPYGNILSQSGSLADANLYRFSSKEFHANSGLVYYLYRYYEPNLQRWINSDPDQEIGGLNLFAFSDSDPINLVDYIGLDCTGTFDRSTGKLTLKDNDTGKQVTVKAFSGNGESTNKAKDEYKKDTGPIPAGKYLIGTKYSHPGSPGDNQWYKLYGPNGRGGYSYFDIPVKAPDGSTVHRGALNLHTGLASDGCLTVPSAVPNSDPRYPTSPDYDKIKHLLDHTKPRKYKGTPFPGTITVK